MQTCLKFVKSVCGFCRLKRHPWEMMALKRKSNHLPSLNDYSGGPDQSDRTNVLRTSLYLKLKVKVNVLKQ